MTLRNLTLSFACLGMALASAGCKNPPGKPGPEPEVGRPDQLVAFAPLYRQNCAGCHGIDGKGGAAISLANPVYLAEAGAANLERVTREGVAGTLMPAFGKQAGGMLTDRQIEALAQGMVTEWGRPDAIAGFTPPPYQSASPGDPAQGQKAFATFCASCHGPDAAGGTSANTPHPGSIVDPAYLALVSDQSLRSAIVAGIPAQGMPDWRSHIGGPGARPMTDQEIADTVAWLASHRVATPGQPYQKSE